MKVQFKGKAWDVDFGMNDTPVKINLTCEGNTEGIWAYLDWTELDLYLARIPGATE